MAKILIVEDDEAIAGLEEDYLAAEGYETETAHDGEEGLSLAVRNRYDLIMLDIMLPKVDGLEICKKIREKSNVPVLLVSAKRDDIDKIRGLGLGADDYIVKPFSPSELVARVIAHIKRYERLTNSEGESEVIEKGSLKIDKSAHRVFVNNQEISFTNKEFENGKT